MLFVPYRGGRRAAHDRDDDSLLPLPPLLIDDGRQRSIRLASPIQWTASLTNMGSFNGRQSPMSKNKY